MAHRTSAAALHAARTVLREYGIAVRPERQLPNQAADEKCLAIVIDLTTNAFRVCDVRPELRYWQERLHVNSATAENIGSFLNHVLDAFESVPKNREEGRMTTTLETPREFGGAPSQHVISRFAIEATSMTFHHYVFSPKRARFGDDESLDRARVAKLIDTGLGLTRAMAALPLLQDCKARLKSGKATVQDVVSCLRKVGIILEYLPNYENREEEVKLL